ncbi:MAG: sugar kinase, partial [Acutalibacter sp.]|nr:sugar kinase [Acutalibacter sp.]
MKLLGIDVGTTGVKAGVFSQDGKMLGCGMETYGVDLPAPGRAEQDGGLVWQKTKLAVRAAVAQGGGDVAAASVSAQGDALLLLDREQRLLAPVQLGMDYRGSAQAEEMEKRWGKEALYKRTGMPPHPLNFFLK